MSVHDLVAWCCEWQKWKRERRGKLGGGVGRHGRREREKKVVLNKDKKILTSAINRAPEVPVSKTVFRTILSTIHMATKALHRFVYGTPKGWQKWTREMRSITPSIRVTCRTADLFMHLTETFAVIRHQSKLGTPPVMPRLLQLILLFQTLLFGFNKDFSSNFRFGFVEPQLKRHEACTWKI